jgi:two-component system sensor histidine kinase SenX3
MTVDPVLLSLVTGLVGLALGVFGMLAYRASEAKHSQLLFDDEPTLPEGAAEVLSVIGRAYVIVDAIDGVVRASPAAYAFGLVRGHTVVHDELLNLTARVRRDGVIEQQQLELPRGPAGQGHHHPAGARRLPGRRVHPDSGRRPDRDHAHEEIRNDFVANVSHELKTPVGAISLLAEALDDAAEDEVAVRRFAQRMHKESGRLSALVQDIIELSRLQGADIVRKGKPVNLNTVIQEAVDRNRLPAESNSIEIVVRGTVDEPVFGDPDQLMTAFRNLIDNAIRYSPEGTRVGIGLRSRDGLAEVSVTDQGTGITAEEQERIFERFYRIDAARSRSTGGTGLGLSIVKHVVSNHGGEVTVWSMAGQGSTFTVRLPEMESAEDAQGTEAQPAAQSTPQPDSKPEKKGGTNAQEQGVSA